MEFASKPCKCQDVQHQDTRTHADARAAPAGKGGHNPPSAGIELAGVLKNDGRSARVGIGGVTIKGFNTGIGINTRGISVKAQNNNISRVTYAVETANTNLTKTIDPVVDFGGGPCSDHPIPQTDRDSLKPVPPNHYTHVIRANRYNYFR